MADTTAHGDMLGMDDRLDDRLGDDGMGAIVTAIKQFATANEGAQATIEYDRKRGARIVLMASDGASADTYAPATDIARQACRRAGVAVVNTWEQELFADIRAQASVW